MLLLQSAFTPETDWAADFQHVTQGMLAKILFPVDYSNPELTGIDFFKLTSRYVSQNNQIVLWLSLAEIILVNTLRSLRRMPVLRKSVSIVFWIVMLATFVVSRLSESFGGF
ncbi:hypothetical protein [Leptothoe spongobia]|uniref:Uncharacterized protein n=1 Tax=Leptothoe spongobia TAU-MAC 1115 TaxID=1967444 RepID=A0A947GKT3_9CYAN|nr:hypothetical protein [Leptothoe spongobia]MBT9317769.1 hypothetical protein [Leptothoe spongobia TAU-MAC 1115]